MFTGRTVSSTEEGGREGPLSSLPFFPRSDSVVPIRNLVLLEMNEEVGQVGGLFVPIEYMDRWPTAGWVRAIGPDVQELNEGDYVCIEEEGTAIGTTYYDVFEVVLKDETGVVQTALVDVEVEPVLREFVEKYRRGGENHRFRTFDRREQQSIAFDASDVASWQFAEVANPEYNLTYIPTYMFHGINPEGEIALFFLISEFKVLAKILY